MPKALPAQPHIDWLKKTAKARLTELRARDPAAKLHQAQRDVAEEYGFKSWRALKAHVDATSLDGRIIAATIEGNAPELGRLLAGIRASSLSPAANGIDRCCTSPPTVATSSASSCCSSGGSTLTAATGSIVPRRCIGPRGAVTSMS